MKTPNSLLTNAIALVICSLCSVLSAFAQLTQVTGFGSNPGALAMYKYVPSGVSANAPLVVVLHGCTQNASQYATETGWNALANTYKFYVVYAEQSISNNSSKCFNWFENGDITRGQGEALSIKQMTDNMKTNHSIDANRVYVTGLSAGGAMTAVMCATYPEIFRGGAVMAGIPYRAGIGTTAAFQAMSPGVDKTPQQWGDLVRNQNPSFSGTWPKMSVFQGSSDYTVRPLNMTELADQWTNVNSADATVDVTNTAFDGVPDITRRVYNGTGGQPVVITYEITGMGHAISVDPGAGTKQGGATGGYAVDKNFFSSYWAADFFGILNTTPPTPPAAPTNLAATATSSSQINLAWTDNATDETGYVVERSTTSGSGFASVATLGANATSYSNTGLAASTTYYYRVRANNGAGNSANSNEANAATQAAPANPPAAPTNLAATATSSSQINLVWTDNATDETGYTVERSATSGSGFTSIATLGANTTSYSNTGLAASTTYYYRVRATNGVGSSANSNEANATTQSSGGGGSTYTVQQLNGTTFITILANDNTAQSFTSVQAGNITKVEFRLQQATTNTGLKIFAGNTVSGTPLYQQTGMNLGSGWQTITLTTPFAVSANTQYTIQLTRASIHYTPSNAYTGGNFWYNAISYTTFDAAFKVTVATSGEGGQSFGGAPQEMLQTQQDSKHIDDTINNQWTIYPNPTGDVFNVVAPKAGEAKHLVMYDLMRRELLNVDLRSDVQSVDCSTLPSGIYTVRLSDGKNVVFKKVIILGR